LITERAMLAAVHISIWTAIKHDRKVSREVAEQHGAYAGAGRYNKQLLREAERLESLRSLSGQIRQYFYKITLPWSDESSSRHSRSRWRSSWPSTPAISSRSVRN